MLLFEVNFYSMQNFKNVIIKCYFLSFIFLLHIVIYFFSKKLLNMLLIPFRKQIVVKEKQILIYILFS